MVTVGWLGGNTGATVLASLALLVLGCAAFGAGRSLPAALLAQASPFLPTTAPPDLVVATIALSTVPVFFMLCAGRVTGRHALSFGAAVGLAAAIHPVSAPVAIVPALLMDRRRVAIALLAAVLACAVVIVLVPTWGVVPAAMPTGPYPRRVVALAAMQPVFVATLVGSAALLAIYFRLRRRGLMPSDRRARVLAGIVAAQGTVALAAALGPDAGLFLPAVLLAGPALALLHCMSRPLFPARVHNGAFALTAVGIALNLLIRSSMPP